LIIDKECKPESEEGKREPDENDSDESSEDESEVEEPGYKKHSRRDHRRSSESLVKLIHKYSPSLEKVCKTDTNCLALYTADNIDLWDATYGHIYHADAKGKMVLDMSSYIEKLEKLRKIIIHMYPGTQTQRGMFVTYTASFKKYYVNKFKEDVRTGEHISNFQKKREIFNLSF
jgi:hypothetical protein